MTKRKENKEKRKENWLKRMTSYPKKGIIYFIFYF